MRLTSTGAGIALALAVALAAAEEPAVLTFDPSTTYQTWEGWGGTLPIEAGTPFKEWTENPTAETFDKNPVKKTWPDDFRDKFLDDAIFDMRLNRFRLELGPQVEIENDNDDPNVANAAAYRFQWQDAVVENQFLPIRKRLESIGVKPVLYISYDLRSALTKPFLLQPAEYAEMAEVFARHLKDKYGIVADYWSVLNEPGNAKRPGAPKLYAELTAATGARLTKAGFSTRMSGPECVNIAQVASYMKAMEETPGALDRFAQITYHLYHGGANKVDERRAVRDWAVKLKVTAAQTEWMEASDMDVARHIYLCIAVANVAAWERYGWGCLYRIDRNGWTFDKNSTGWYCRQFMRYVRPGSVRVEMKSADDAIKPVAFLSTNRKPIVVILNTGNGPRSIRIEKLPAGTYAASRTAPKAFGKDLPAIAVEDGGSMTMDLPALSATTLTADPPPPGPAGTSKPEPPDAPTKKETPAAPKGTGEKRDGKEDGNGGGTKTADASKTVPRQGAVASQDPPPQRSKRDDTTIAQGTVVGTVVSKGPGWIEVKSESGKTERYIAEWRGGLPKDGGGPDPATAQAIAKLSVGDRVRLQWRVNDHVRVVSIAHAE